MKKSTSITCIPSAVIALAFCIGTAKAETALERELLQDPAPHTIAPKSGAKVIAHYATTNGYIEGMPRNKERVAAMKKAFDVCLKNSGTSETKIPTEWPDFIVGHRYHTYTTERYEITYRRAWGYALLPDCSLFEAPSYSAILSSSAGTCRMDLTYKIANGQCNMAAHRAAKRRPPSAQPQGPLQVIAGLRCAKSSMIGTDLCHAVDGRMKPSFPLLLSLWSDYGLHDKAVSAALDIEVSESLFEPHAQAGFTVKAKNP